MCAFIDKWQLRELSVPPLSKENAKYLSRDDIRFGLGRRSCQHVFHLWILAVSNLLRKPTSSLDLWGAVKNSTHTTSAENKRNFRLSEKKMNKTSYKELGRTVTYIKGCAVQQHTWRERSPWRPNKPHELISAILSYSQCFDLFNWRLPSMAKGTRQLVKLHHTLPNLCSTLRRNPWHWHPTVVFSVAHVTESCPNHHEWIWSIRTTQILHFDE